MCECVPVEGVVKIGVDFFEMLLQLAKKSRMPTAVSQRRNVWKWGEVVMDYVLFICCLMCINIGILLFS